MSQQKIRILHIIKSLGRGGAEMLLPETLRLHHKDQFEFHCIYFLPWKDQMVESLRKGGATVNCFSASNNLMMMTKFWALKRYVRENKIQLIHSHLPWAGIVSRILGRTCNIPVIYTEHNKQERYHVGTRFMNLLTMNLLTEVIAVSHDVADSINKHKPHLSIPLRLISNGVNTEIFARDRFSGIAVREKLGIPERAPIVGTVAVFRTQKRLDLWMELASIILKRIDNVHFVMVGDGPLKEELLRKRKALGMENRIHMPGLQTEVQPYLSVFDVYMMCSRFEGLPVALLEAMSMECPPVSTDAGGIKEVIRHGMDGLICSLDEPEKLVEYACSILSDEGLRMKYGLMARQRVIQQFSLEKMVHELEEIYTRLTSSR